jgi:hypothetical protein
MILGIDVIIVSPLVVLVVQCDQRIHGNQQTQRQGGRGRGGSREWSPSLYMISLSSNMLLQCSLQHSTLAFNVKKTLTLKVFDNLHML